MKRQKKKLIGLVSGGVIVAVVAAGGFAFASGSSTAGHYRTYEAQSGSVAQTLSLTGTIASATRRDVAFSTAGTVATIDVVLGDTVTAGQTIATLDDDELADAVQEAREAVADARTQLATDLEAQSSSSSTTTSASTTSASTTSASTTSASTTSASTASAATASVSVASYAATASDTASQATTAGTSQDATAAAAVFVAAENSSKNTAQTVADTTAATDLAAAQTAYNTARAAVQTAQDNLIGKYDEVTGESANSDDDVTDVTGSAGACAAFLAVTDPADDQAAAFLAQCQAAILAAQGSLDQVQALQAELTALAQTLDEKTTALDAAAQVLATAAAAAGTDTDGTGTGGTGTNNGDSSGGAPTGDTPTGDTPSGDTPTGDSPTGDAPSGGTQGGSSASGGMGSQGGSSASTTISAARILADRAEITVAKAKLASAQQARKAGVLTSPIAGTVADIGLTSDQSVSAGDTSSVITILGTDGYVITATADLADAKLLEVGQVATGTLSGETEAITGTVSSIGVTNASTSSTPSYAIELAVDSVTEGLGEGASIATAVAIANQEDVLTLPTSAVSHTGSQASVLVYQDGETVSRDVVVGAVGTELTEITSGLEAGETVILADLNQAVTSDDDSESSSGLSGLGGSTSTTDRSSFGPPSGFSGGGMPVGRG